MLGFTRRRGATLIYVFGGFVAPMLVPSLAAAQDSAPLRPVEADLRVRLDCDHVAATLKLPDATVTAARLVPAGSFTPPATGAETPRPVAGLPAFCRVELAIKPSSDSDIRSEVWMPVSGWNGKFHPETGIQTSLRMSESDEGLMASSTRQNAGRPATGRGVSAPVAGGVNDPAGTSRAAVTVAS